MISEDLLQILQCPSTRQPLKLADASLVARVNAAISEGRAVNRLGEAVRKTLDGGLVNQNQTLLYGIFDDIPCLLVDEAIELGPYLA